MNKTQVNPWTWQDQRGFSQAWKVEDGRTVIFVSGQVSNTAEGRPVHEGDFAAQARVVFENLRTVLERAGASLDDVVKLGVFLTDMSRMPEYGAVKAEFFKGPQPASTAVGVTSLAAPAYLIEVEATAVV
ncbi:MAG TPA: Rid family hydrolase [Chloroflexota bacterium]|nr:Rid family hydrolase [Chloroflexota bacterium]